MKTAELVLSRGKYLRDNDGEVESSQYWGSFPLTVVSCE
jgi:hypothetical protein